jgi:choline dehydrogenase-like flavoprotein
LEETHKFNSNAHHIGTTRMHSDPRQGVVDPNGNVHLVRNLYVAGSSVFPTGGHANPTLTIVALALRLADHLKKELR